MNQQSRTSILPFYEVNCKRGIGMQLGFGVTGSLVKVPLVTRAKVSWILNCLGFSSTKSDNTSARSRYTAKFLKHHDLQGMELYPTSKPKRI